MIFTNRSAISQKKTSKNNERNCVEYREELFWIGGIKRLFIEGGIWAERVLNEVREQVMWRPGDGVFRQ